MVAYNSVSLLPKPRRLSLEEIEDLLAGRGCTISLEARAVLQRASDEGRTVMAEDMVLSLAEQYRPPNMAAGNLRMLWGYNRFDIAEVLRRAIQHCEQHQHAQYTVVEQGAEGGL